MRKNYLLLILSMILSPFLAMAQEAPAGLDQRINDAVQPITDAVSSVVFYSISVGNGLSVPIVLIILIAAATYFT
ncbi:MAG: alanine glycine permease, partial [Saprospiraceae bacterium]